MRILPLPVYGKCQQMRSFGNRILRASVSSYLDVNSGIMKDWSSFFGDPSDLARGCDFGSKEESIVRDVLLFIMKHEEVRKQLCTDTMSPTDALQFAVVKERGEMLFKKVSGGVSKFERNKFHLWRQNPTGNNKQGYINRKPVNDINGQRSDKCHL